MLSHIIKVHYRQIYVFLFFQHTITGHDWVMVMWESMCKEKTQTCSSDCNCPSIVALKGRESRIQNHLFISVIVFFLSGPPYLKKKIKKFFWNNPTVDVKLTPFSHIFKSLADKNFLTFPIVFSASVSRNTRTQKARGRQRIVAWWEDLPVKIFSDQEWIKGDNTCFGIYGVHNPPLLSHPSIACHVFISCFFAQCDERV